MQEGKKRVMLIVAYDGTNYCGWQIQPNGNTIEGELNRALSELLGEKIIVSGASRTDAGVHSCGNVAVFDTTARMPAEKMSYAMNQRLPEDIVVQCSKKVPLDFHPRHVKSKKTYEYRILNREFRDPNRRLDTYFYYRHLDVHAMRVAAGYLVGEHDFKSFCSIHARVETTVRRIYALTVDKKEDIITIRITGNGFLYNMVRIIAGTLVEVGLEKIEAEKIPDIIQSKKRENAGKTLPPNGLYLLQVEYN